MERWVVEVVVVVIVKRGGYPMSDVRGVGLDGANRILINDNMHMVPSRYKGVQNSTLNIRDCNVPASLIMCGSTV